MIYAYARCSVNESEEEQRQLFTALQASGAEKGIIEYEENDPSDKVTLEMLLEYVRPGDTMETSTPLFHCRMAERGASSAHG